MITKEFLLSEIKHIEDQIPRVHEYLISANAVLASHKIMLKKIEDSESEVAESSDLVDTVDMDVD